jgi:hypothetical protein
VQYSAPAEVLKCTPQSTKYWKKALCIAPKCQASQPSQRPCNTLQGFVSEKTRDAPSQKSRTDEKISPRLKYAASTSNSHPGTRLDYLQFIISFIMLYCGTHTSLYSTLPSEAVTVLEDAILKSRARLYDAAEEVFDNELSEYSHVPVVAIEHAETLLHRYKNYRILDVLAAVPAGQPSKSEEHKDVHRLIALTVGIAKMLTEGMDEPAMEEVVRLRRDWASKPVDKYTDIQVTINLCEKSNADLLPQIQHMLINLLR